MTGTALSLITKNNKHSYNKAVNAINRHQKENIGKLQKAITKVQQPRLELYLNIIQLQANLQELKEQVYLNQVLIDNWDKSAPYSYPVEMLA